MRALAVGTITKRDVWVLVYSHSNALGMIFLDKLMLIAHLWIFHI